MIFGIFILQDMRSFQLKSNNFSIKDILHERAWLLEDVFAVRVSILQYHLVQTKARVHQIKKVPLRASSPLELA